MIPVLLKKEALSLDESTISSGHLSEKDLMENAGKSIAQFVAENIYDPFNQKFNVFAGPGNNGGDAIICHYFLFNYGINSELILFDKGYEESWIYKKYKIDSKSIKYYDDKFELNPDHWFIDGIFGIGLKRNLDGKYKKIIDSLIYCPKIISIDMPSGIYCDNGKMAGTNINAVYTLTMGYHKLGHYFNDGLDASGEVHVLDIGFKPLTEPHSFLQLIDHEDVCGQLPVYSENAHKYTRGKLVTISGSKGYTGACILAIHAAMKTGVGIVKAIIPESLTVVLETILTEAISIPIQEHDAGTFTTENSSDILIEADWADAVIFGPGLKVDANSGDWMAQVLRKLEKPLILDASGFLPLIENKMIIGELPAETILTPHIAEFSRIFDLDIKQVMNDPISAVKDIIPILENRVLILKGATNIIVNTCGEILLMNHGTPALATAGTGDVLAGIIGALLAQGEQLDDAALLAIFLQGECVHQYNKLVSCLGLTASDLPAMLPFALDEVFHVH